MGVPAGGLYGAESDDEDSDDGDDDNTENAFSHLQSDPQVLKLQDRIKFFRHRCVASLGNNMYQKAYDFLKESNAEGSTPEEKREGLIQVLGEEWIGFWAILDQVLFYEGMVDELNLAAHEDTADDHDND